MKYIFIAFLISTSYFSFGQITPSEMIKIYKMDLDQFETYAISKGFMFYELMNNEYYYGHSYKESNEKKQNI